MERAQGQPEPPVDPKARGRGPAGLRRRSGEGASTRRWGGGSTPTSPSTTASASCSSRRRARPARSLRHGHHVGRAGLGAGPAADRLRHRRGARGARRRAASTSARSFHDATAAIFHPGRAAGPSRLRLVRRVQRPGRQRLALQEITTRLPGRVRDRRFTRPRGRAPAGCRRTASTRSAPASRRELARLVRRTWSEQRDGAAA